MNEPLTSNPRVSAYTAAEWLSVGVTDKLVPLADYERLRAAIKSSVEWFNRPTLPGQHGHFVPLCALTVLTQALGPEAHENE